jgi:Phosphodiester glycosidase
VLAALMAAVLSLGTAVAAPPPAPPPTPPPEAGPERTLAEQGRRTELAPGVTHRGLRTTAAAGQVLGDVIEVDLTEPGVHAALLMPDAVAARSRVVEMADRTGATAGINGDFFDIDRTNAPVGPAVAAGRPVKAAAPPGRRRGPAVPGAEVDHVFTVGTDGIARIDRLRLEAWLSGPSGTHPVAALNQHAVPVDGIGIFTPLWGEVGRAATLCGTDDDPAAPCAADQAEALLRGGTVIRVGRPTGGRIPAGQLALTGRDEGAAVVRSLEAGDRLDVEYRLVPDSGQAPELAVGASPVMFDGAPVAGLDDRERAPRSAAGTSADGRRIWLLTLDGRQSDSVGATLRELAALLREMGMDDAVNLDGGGSSTLVFRDPDASDVTIVNDPSGATPRLVPNGIGIYTGSGEPDPLAHRSGAAALPHPVTGSGGAAFRATGYWPLTRGGHERGCPWECRAGPGPPGPPR